MAKCEYSKCAADADFQALTDFPAQIHSTCVAVCVYMSLNNIKVNNSTVIEVDNEPISGSDNLVKSGGVFDKVTVPYVSYKKDVTATYMTNPTQVVDIRSGSQVKVKFIGISTDIPSSTYIQFGFNDANGQTIGGAHNIYATDNWESDFITLTDDAVLAWLIFYGNDWSGQSVEWKILERRKYVSDAILQLEEDKFDKSDVIQAVEKNNTTNVPSSGAVFEKVVSDYSYIKEIGAIPNSNPTQVIDIKTGNKVKCKINGLPNDLSSSNYIEFGYNDANEQTIGGAHNIYATDNWESDDITLTDNAVLAWLVFHGSGFDRRNVDWEVITQDFISEIIAPIQNDLLTKLRKSDVIQVIEKNNTTQVPSSGAVFEKVTFAKERTISKTVPAIRMTNPTQIVDIKSGEQVKFKFSGISALAATNYVQFGLNDANEQTIFHREVYASDNWESDFITLSRDAVLAWLIFYGSDWSGETVTWDIQVKTDVFVNDYVKNFKNIDLQKYQFVGDLLETERGYGIDYDSGEVVNSGYATVTIGPIPIDSSFKLLEVKNRISAAGAGIVFYTKSGTKLKPVGRANYSDETNELLEVPDGAVSFKCSAAYNKEHRVYFYTSRYEKNNYKLLELFGAEIGNRSNFGNSKIATNYCEGEGSSLSPYTSGDNTGGINTAINENTDRGGKVVIPIGEYTISSPIIIKKDCINLEGEIWNYPAHPNGVYESNNGSKLKLASSNIPAIKLSQIWNGWRIAQIGVAGTVSNGGTKGLFDKSNPGINCGLLINTYTDQFEVNRVSFEGLAAGIVGINCTWDAGIISRVNADGCNIGIYLETDSTYYDKIKDCILSDCPAFGMYIKSNSSFEGLEICGNVMVRNGGGLTSQQIEDFGGEDEIASCVIKGLRNSIFKHNFIHQPGVWMNSTSGTPTAEYQDMYGVLFDASMSSFENNNIQGDKGNIIRGNRVNVANNVMLSKLMIYGENHLVSGNILSEIVVYADGCYISNNQCT